VQLHGIRPEVSLRIGLSRFRALHKKLVELRDQLFIFCHREFVEVMLCDEQHPLAVFLIAVVVFRQIILK
jgi:hypothetical protein